MQRAAALQLSLNPSHGFGSHSVVSPAESHECEPLNEAETIPTVLAEALTAWTARLPVDAFYFAIHILDAHFAWNALASSANHFLIVAVSVFYALFCNYSCHTYIVRTSCIQQIYVRRR